MITTEQAALDPALAAVTAVVDEFDRACSRFRADSELCRVNRAGGRPVAVGPVLLEAVGAAVRAAELTDGDVDPALGFELVALGYDRDFERGLDGRGRLPEAGRAHLSARPGWRTIRVDPEAGTLALGRGVRLDLGATAKALACDRAARAACAAGGAGVLVGLGGDLSCAGPAPAGGWPVRVTDDHRAVAGEPGQWITIQSGGLATSSTAVRRWRTADGSPAHHLLDPRGGGPVRSPWRTVSVAAGSCLDANIAATAALVRGERAVGWLRWLALPGRLVDLRGRAAHVAGWPEAGEELPLRDEARVAPA